MPRGLSHPNDVPVFARFARWVLRLGEPTPECAGSGECPVAGTIRELHSDHDGVVGSPRMWEDLRYAGERCGRHRVARLMRRAGLQGVPQRRCPP